MNEIESLRELIERKLGPSATLTIEAPKPPRPNAAWWLHVEFNKHEVAVEWKPGRGFGITSPAERFGEGSDEVCEDVDMTAARVLELLQKGARTKSPGEAALARLRHSRRISQEALAKALNIRQAAVSKMERRSDMYVSTLRKAIAAMGGELEMSARFPDQVVRITDLGEDDNMF
jgi:hypothetical protein